MVFKKVKLEISFQIFVSKLYLAFFYSGLREGIFCKIGIIFATKVEIRVE